jgi:uncharacterized protein YwgA
MNSQSTDVNYMNDEAWNPESALDILIALLYAKGNENEYGEPIEGITRLDKLMFILYKNPKFEKIIEKGYNFQPDNFGPFAPELFDDIEALKDEKVIKVNSSRNPKTHAEVAAEEINTLEEEIIENDYQVKEFKLTEEGIEIGKLIWNGLSIEQQSLLNSMKKFWTDRSLDELLHYVYKKYPETAEKSRIKDRYLS